MSFICSDLYLPVDHCVEKNTYVYVFKVASNGPKLNDSKLITGFKLLASSSTTYSLNSKFMFVTPGRVVNFTFKLIPGLITSSNFSSPIYSDRSCCKHFFS